MTKREERKLVAGWLAEGLSYREIADRLDAWKAGEEAAIKACRAFMRALNGPEVTTK